MKTNLLRLTVLMLGIIIIGLPGYTYAKVSVTEPPKSKKAETKTRTTKIDLSTVKIKNVQFGFDRSGLSEKTYARLNRVAKLMADNNAAIKLSGHADNKGAYVYNWKLSAARAATVKDYLISKGADSSRIAATEFGDTKPIASNKTKLGRQQNRRVEIDFVQ